MSPLPRAGEASLRLPAAFSRRENRPGPSLWSKLAISNGNSLTDRHWSPGPVCAGRRRRQDGQRQRRRIDRRRRITWSHRCQQQHRDGHCQARGQRQRLCCPWSRKRGDCTVSVSNCHAGRVCAKALGGDQPGPSRIAVTWGHPRPCSRRLGGSQRGAI